MRRFLSILIAIASLLCLFGCAGGQKDSGTGENPPLIREDLMWNTEEMFAREVTVTESDRVIENANGTTKAIFFAGEPYQGRPTNNFAYIGYPSAPMPAGGYPAVVLVHGGGGCAFYEWVEYWNGKGYVAIAPDFAGQQFGSESLQNGGAPKNPDGGPSDYGSFHSTAENYADSWVYHGISNIILAHNILLADENVNGEQIGLTGISWGGVLTCIASGVDYRFQAFAPVYGAGYILMTPSFTEKSYYTPPEDPEEWMEYYDPSTYLCYNEKPILFTLGMNDPVFSPYLNQMSANLCEGDVYYSQRQDLTHYHRWRDNERMIHVSAFMDEILLGRQMPFRVESSEYSGNTLSARIRNMENMEYARIIYTSSTETDTRDWVWLSVPLNDSAIDGDRITAQIPAGTTACFLEFSNGDYNEFILSTEIYFID